MELVVPAFHAARTGVGDIFPALASFSGAVFSRQRAFFLLAFVIALQYGLAVCDADFIVDPAVLYQIVVVLVQLFSCFEADRVDQTERIAACLFSGIAV
jgi:hypothetical protein